MTPVVRESLLGYHPCSIGFLTSSREPAGGQCQVCLLYTSIVFGEVGLSGEVRAVSMPEQRVAEAKKLGFEICILPKVCLDMVKEIKGIKLLGVGNISDAINLL